MSAYVLVLNAGSSSLKFCVYGEPSGDTRTAVAQGQIEGIGTSSRLSARDDAGQVPTKHSEVSTRSCSPAGIGENSAAIRARICDSSAWLGVELDRDANAHRGTRISTAASRVSAFVIATNEELMIARHTGARLGLTSGQP